MLRLNTCCDLTSQSWESTDYVVYLRARPISPVCNESFIWHHEVAGQSSVCVCVLSRALLFATLQPSRLLCPWNFSGKNTGAGCHFLLQGIFLIQGSNPRLLHWRQILYLWAIWLIKSLKIVSMLEAVCK